MKMRNCKQICEVNLKESDYYNNKMFYSRNNHVIKRIRFSTSPPPTSQAAYEIVFVVQKYLNSFIARSA